MSSQEPIGLLIAAARRRIRQVVGERVRPLQLSPQQFWILVSLLEEGGQTLRCVAERRGMDEPTASRVVTALAGRRLVEIRTDAKDRRRSRLHPSRGARALRGTLLDLAEEIRGLSTRGLSPAEEATLRRLLGRVIENLNRELGRGASGPRTGPSGASRRS